MATLEINVQARDETQDGLDDVERSAEQTAERLGRTMSASIAGAVAAALGAALESLDAALEQREQRINELEVLIGATTDDEQDLQRRLSGSGFTDFETARGVQATRAFDLDPTSQAANELSQTVATLERAGVNTRFLPQLADRFGIEDSDTLVDQLNVGFDIVSQTGVDFEEIYSEIADNPQVYGAFPTFAHAAQFLSQTGLTPAESTIQLEQGALQPTGGLVGGDPYALTAITPSAGERIANNEAFQFAGGIVDATVGQIPVVGGAASGLFQGAGSLAERVRGTDLDVSGDLALGFSGDAGSVIVDGVPVGFAPQGPGVGSTDRPAGIYSQPPVARGADDRSEAALLANQIQSLITAIERRENANQNLPQGITYDAEKAAAANQADLRRIGILTGELRELEGR